MQHPRKNFLCFITFDTRVSPMKAAPFSNPIPQINCLHELNRQLAMSPRPQEISREGTPASKVEPRDFFAPSGLWSLTRKLLHVSWVKQEMSGIQRLQRSVLSCFPASSHCCNSCVYSLHEPGQLLKEFECADLITLFCVQWFQVEQKVLHQIETAGDKELLESITVPLKEQPMILK